MQQGWQDMEQQLIELRYELRKLREERDRAHRVLEETEWKALASANDRTTIEILEAELDESRESEKRMLESLASQTQQLEHTKISLEESRLEIKSQQETIQKLHNSPGATPRGRSDCDVQRLSAELWLALAAEDKSKKAMEDLVLALKEVTAELQSTKQQLARAQHEAETARLEADRLHMSLKRKDDKLRAASDDVGRLRTDAEESFAAWRGKEAGFTACMKASEEELAVALRENARLLESQRAARDEIAKLRDILKQAIKDSNVVKQSLEVARSENAQLSEMVGDKDNAFKCAKQELECLKVTEAAACESVKELQSLLVATSTSPTSAAAKMTDEDRALTPRPMTPLPVLTKYRSDTKIKPLAGLGRPRGESENFEGSVFDIFGSPDDRKEDHGVFSTTPSVLGRRRPVMSKFGSLFRWKSFK